MEMEMEMEQRGGEEYDDDIVGTHFIPTEEELIADYLCPWVAGQPMASDFVTVAEVSSMPPWELLAGREEAYFIFERKQLGSSRTSRTMESGKWKKDSTGKEETAILDSGETVRWKKSMLSFHLTGYDSSSGFVMHEYQLCEPAGSRNRQKKRKISSSVVDSSSSSSSSPRPPPQWVLCLIKMSARAQKSCRSRKRAQEEEVSLDVFDKMPSMLMLSQDSLIQSSRSRKRAQEEEVSLDVFDKMPSTLMPSQDTLIQSSEHTSDAPSSSGMFQDWVQDDVDEILHMLEEVDQHLDCEPSAESADTLVIPPVTVATRSQEKFDGSVGDSDQKTNLAYDQQVVVHQEALRCFDTQSGFGAGDVGNFVCDAEMFDCSFLHYMFQDVDAYTLDEFTDMTGFNMAGNVVQETAPMASPPFFA
ncbi:uncharacterized protein [Typha latifolia]|uniref:uncharacterized protein n=1 Tax=Typha latifolia TaxID=4733 RepID=UPI003C308A49